MVRMERVTLVVARAQLGSQHRPGLVPGRL
jgi:hypothetical protein